MSLIYSNIELTLVSGSGSKTTGEEKAERKVVGLQKAHRHTRKDKTLKTGGWILTCLILLHPTKRMVVQVLKEHKSKW